MDTFRSLHPDIRAATHYAAVGGGASRLDYILSSSPEAFTPVAAAIHVAAIWPFDHTPVLTDFWGASPLHPAAPGPGTIRWRNLQASISAACSADAVEALRAQVRDSLPFDVPEEGESHDGVIEALEASLDRAASASDRAVVEQSLDRVALALHGSLAAVTASLAGVSRPGGPRAPPLPPGSP